MRRVARQPQQLLRCRPLQALQQQAATAAAAARRCCCEGAARPARREATRGREGSREEGRPWRRRAHRPLREDALAVAEAAEAAVADTVSDAVTEPPPKKKKKKAVRCQRGESGGKRRSKGRKAPRRTRATVPFFIFSALFLRALRPDCKHFTE